MKHSATHTSSGNSTRGVVLIADDTIESLGMLNETLVQAGYTVLVAMDGLQALAVAERMMPDLILMDAIMPNMDGFEACEALKKDPDLEGIPVIFMTGLSDSIDVVRGLEAGGVDYVTKPVNLDVLLARVQVHITNARKTRRAIGSLNEIGQPTFACDVHGQLLWCSSRTIEVLAKAGLSEHDFQEATSAFLASWFASAPERFQQVRIEQTSSPLLVKFLGLPAPGEYLLRLVDDDEVSLRQTLRDHFQLTVREAEVLLWLSRGKTNQEIGRILSMSPRTVNKHLETVFRKMGVENRTSAAALSLGYLSRL
tara:strand:- start:911 stop:1843 length:933 start_codon:yes stop_codon:yes gene_type:complete